MMTQIHCPHCRQALSIPPLAPGQALSCPTCQRTIAAPAVVAVPEKHRASPWPMPAQPPSPMWFVQTPDGQSFGPVAKMELDSWVADGAVPGDSLLMQQGSAQWLQARNVYPILSNQINNNIVINVDSGPSSSYSGSSGRYKQQHRGSLILILALLGWFLVPLLCVVAWVMGAEDLKKMRLGKMDRSGEGMTFCGMVLGMIGTCIMLLAIVAVVLIIIAGAAAG